MITTNFHTHCIYCDGKDTPEEMIKTAIDKGFTSLGFSSHSFYGPSSEYTMSLENEPLYFEEINRLKETYKGKIEIFCGIEQDYYSPEKRFPYDYSIGSVHCVEKDGVSVVVDDSAKILNGFLDRFYDGDYDALAEEYFILVGDVINKTGADIIGHIDLITKYNEKENRTLSKKFFDCAEKAVKKLAVSGKPFEINTGAIARGYRTTPYPSPEILEMIKGEKGKIIFSSDCHNREFLDCCYAEAEKLAKSIGFKAQSIITAEGLKEIEL